MITNDLVEVMTVAGSAQRRFNNSFTVQLDNGESITAWIDRQHPIKVDPSPERFSEWLRRERIKDSSDIKRAAEGSNSGKYAIGGATRLVSALTPSGFERISLQEDLVSRLRVEPQDEAKWKERYEPLRGAPGALLSVVRACEELTDDSFQVWWRSSPYGEVRAFQELAEKSDDVRARYLKKASDVLENRGTTVLNSLCHHILVVLGQSGDGQQVCLAHRKARPGGWLGSRWSLGIEENFRAQGRILDTGRILERDVSVEGVIDRAVREELVGERYEKTIKVSVHGVSVGDGTVSEFRLPCDR